MLLGRYPFVGTIAEMEVNQVKANFEFPHKLRLSDEVIFSLGNLFSGLG